MMMRRACLLLAVVVCACQSTAPRPAAAGAAASGTEWRVIEFSDHPDANLGAPHVLAAPQPWPNDVMSLAAAVSTSVEKSFTGVADLRRGPATEGAIAELNETKARLVSVDDAGAHVRVRMDAAPEPLDVTVPRNGTVVIGGERDDDRHAFVAISLFDAPTAADVPVVYTPREPGVTAPKPPAGATLPAPAGEPMPKGIVVETDVAADGRVLAAHALTHDAAQAARVESTVSSWKFTPAMREGKPVRAIADITLLYVR